MKYDLTNQTFGFLTALHPAGHSRGYTLWACRCVCGKIVGVTSSNLVRGKIKSCGCKQYNYRNISGRRRGHLTALRKTDKRNKSGQPIYEWRCDCGNIVEGPANSAHSCPECQRREKINRLIDGQAKIVRDETTGLKLGVLNSIKKGKAYKNSRSGIRGVCWNKQFEKWEAYGVIDGKTKLLGRFKSLEEAKEAREEFVKGNYYPGH